MLLTLATYLNSRFWSRFLLRFVKMGALAPPNPLPLPSDQPRSPDYPSFATETPADV